MGISPQTHGGFYGDFLGFDRDMIGIEAYIISGFDADILGKDHGIRVAPNHHKK